VSDSSTWGNAGGQWLLFHARSDGGYAYWGTLFFSTGAASLRVSSPGAGELTVYVRTSASRGTLQTYRLTSAGMSVVASTALDLETADGRSRHDAALKAGARLPVESCRLLEYRRDPDGCWRPGLGLR